MKKVLFGIILFSVFICSCTKENIDNKKPKKKLVKEEVVAIDKEVQEKIEIDQILGKAQRAALKAEWTQAIALCQKALDKDPINLTAKKLKSKYIDEKEYKLIFNKAKQELELKKFKNAIIYFKKIPEKTFYEEKAKVHIKELKDKLKNIYFNETKLYYKTKKFKDSYVSLKKVFKVSAFNQQEIELKTKIEQAMKKNGIKFEKFEVKVDDKPNEKKNLSLKEKIKKIYPEKEIVKSIKYYVNGDIKNSIKYLSKINITNPSHSKAKPILKKILVIKAKYSSGNTFIRKKEHDKAISEWEEVLEADKMLLEGITTNSKYSEIIREYLSKKFYEKGKEALENKKYKLAFIQLNKSLKYNPQNTDTLSELTKIRKITNDFWAKSLKFEENGNKVALKYWQAIADMTNKGDKLNKKAIDKLSTIK